MGYNVAYSSALQAPVALANPTGQLALMGTGQAPAIQQSAIMPSVGTLAILSSGPTFAQQMATSAGVVSVTGSVGTVISGTVTPRGPVVGSVFVLAAPPTLTRVTAASSTRIHPGHGFWYDNFRYPGNQQAPLQASLSTIGNVNNFFNRVELCFTMANISDGTLTNGKQTFTTFTNNLTDILTRVKTVTTKKLYVTLKVITGDFSSTPFGGIDRSFYPNWVPTSWVKIFQQPNTNYRQQLDFDNQAIWDALLEMATGVANVINALDTDNRIDIVNFINDESVVANVDINGAGILNASNYNTQYQQFHLNCKPLIPNRVLWNPLSYLPPGDGVTDVAAMCGMFNALQAAYPNGGIGYGGPDPTAYGIHGSGTSWATTWQSIATGKVGTLGDIRDKAGVLHIAHVEGFGLGSGTNFANCPPPSGSAQQLFVDLMTRQAVAAHGGIGAHNGYGNQVMIWNWQNISCLKTADMLAVVNANNGFFNPLPPGNWDTSP